MTTGEELKIGTAGVEKLRFTAEGGVVVEGVTLRPEVLQFAVEMEKKLQANDHKTPWDKDSLGWLLKRLKEELVEAEEASKAIGPADYAGEDIDELCAAAIREWADVANFAMMLADKIRRRSFRRVRS